MTIFTLILSYSVSTMLIMMAFYLVVYRETDYYGWGLLTTISIVGIGAIGAALSYIVVRLLVRRDNALLESIKSYLLKSQLIAVVFSAVSMLAIWIDSLTKITGAKGFLTFLAIISIVFLYIVSGYDFFKKLFNEKISLILFISYLISVVVLFILLMPALRAELGVY